MTLYFITSKGAWRFLGFFESESEAFKRIHSYCRRLNPNFKIYYTRKWQDDKGDLWYDVGSHTEFFVITNRILGDEPQEEQALIEEDTNNE